MFGRLGAIGTPEDQAHGASAPLHVALSPFYQWHHLFEQGRSMRYLDHQSDVVTILSTADSVQGMITGRNQFASQERARLLT